ncbi:MAG: hypothetical protein ABSE28_18025 [Candidatus Sulfotelmatobacter sp.]|jgi:hypothetical protein
MRNLMLALLLSPLLWAQPGLVGKVQLTGGTVVRVTHQVVALSWNACTGAIFYNVCREIKVPTGADRTSGWDWKHNEGCFGDECKRDECGQLSDRRFQFHNSSRSLSAVDPAGATGPLGPKVRKVPQEPQDRQDSVGHKALRAPPARRVRGARPAVVAAQN